VCELLGRPCTTRTIKVGMRKLLITPQRTMHLPPTIADIRRSITLATQAWVPVTAPITQAWVTAHITQVWGTALIIQAWVTALTIQV